MTTQTTQKAGDLGSSRDILRLWYANHKGHLYRCNDIAAALWAEGVTLGAADQRGLTHKVATFSYRLWQRGEVQRTRMDVVGHSQPVTYYGHLPTNLMPELKPGEPPKKEKKKK